MSLLVLIILICRTALFAKYMVYQSSYALLFYISNTKYSNNRIFKISRLLFELELYNITSLQEILFQMSL